MRFPWGNGNGRDRLLATVEWLILVGICGTLVWLAGTVQYRTLFRDHVIGTIVDEVKPECLTRPLRKQ